MYQITSLKKRIIQAIIILIFLLSLLHVSKKDINIEINEKTKITTYFEISPNTMYFVVYTPKKEFKITNTEDILNIQDKFNFITDSYEYKGDFKYTLVLSCVNEKGIIESNLLIKDNYLVNGNRVFIHETNLEKFLTNLEKNQ